MALELLAGPYDVKWQGVQKSFLKTPHWLDDLGLVGYLETGVVYEYNLVQLDGVAWVRNNNGSAFAAQDFSWDLQRDSLLWSDGTGAQWTFDPLVGAIEEQLKTGGVIRWTRLGDRYLYALANFSGVSVLQAPLTATSSSEFATEYNFTGRSQSSGRGYISNAGSNRVYVAYPNGDLYLYDYVQKVQIGKWQSIDLTHKGLWYSLRHDLFVSAHDAGSYDQIRVWANETRPATLSTPAALSPVQKGSVSAIRVQCLGSAGEPVPDLPVDWSLTAGSGSLQATQSVTDADGYAQVDYLAPANATGSATIQAQVKF